MKMINMRLTAREPIIATNGSSEGMAHSCLDYVPGNMLLGAFAGRWKRLHKGEVADNSPAFQKVFLDGSVSWGDACPLCGVNPVIPVPLCFMREKNMAGLPVAGTTLAQGEAAVFNPLPLADDDSMADLYKTLGKAESPKFKKLSAAFIDPASWFQPDLRKVWNTRVALGRTRAAQKGMLFGFSAMAPSTRFMARIFCGSGAEPHLKELLGSGGHIHVGHSRSSGYGLADYTVEWLEAPVVKPLSDTIFNLLLLSHYFPDPPWADPLADFLEKIGALAGSEPKIEKIFLAYCQLESFNSHWGAWRGSRQGLQAGSVLRLSFAQKVSLDSDLMVGACQLEGYGRIAVNLPILEERLHIYEGQRPPMPAPAAVKQPNLKDPVWALLRRRAMGRMAARVALHWLEHPSWIRFLEAAAKLSKPTASQRANIQAMSLKTFEAILKKTPGRQWKRAIAPDPFAGGQKEHLSEIMLSLLNMDKFLAAFPLQDKDKNPELVPPGGPLAPEEAKELAALSYSVFKRELIRTWGKYAVIGQSADRR